MVEVPREGGSSRVLDSRQRLRVGTKKGGQFKEKGDPALQPIHLMQCTVELDCSSTNVTENQSARMLRETMICDLEPVSIHSLCNDPATIRMACSTCGALTVACGWLRQYLANLVAAECANGTAERPD